MFTIVSERAKAAHSTIQTFREPDQSTQIQTIVKIDCRAVAHVRALHFTVKGYSLEAILTLFKLTIAALRSQ